MRETLSSEWSIDRCVHDSGGCAPLRRQRDEARHGAHRRDVLRGAQHVDDRVALEEDAQLDRTLFEVEQAGSCDTVATATNDAR
jgi:hypothetical protein